MDRRLMIEAAYNSAKARLGGITLDEFDAAVSACECHPVEVDGRLVGAVLVHGPEMHACVNPEGFGRWFSRKFIALIDSVAKKHGFAMTRAETQAGRDFVSRLGFKEERPGVFVRAYGH